MARSPRRPTQPEDAPALCTTPAGAGAAHPRRLGRPPRRPPPPLLWPPPPPPHLLPGLLLRSQLLPPAAAAARRPARAPAAARRGSAADAASPACCTGTGRGGWVDRRGGGEEAGNGRVNRGGAESSACKGVAGDELFRRFSMHRGGKVVEVPDPSTARHHQGLRDDPEPRQNHMPNVRQGTWPEAGPRQAARWLGRRGRLRGTDAPQAVLHGRRRVCLRADVRHPRGLELRLKLAV